MDGIEQAVSGADVDGDGRAALASAALERLDGRSLVLTGLMGVGKTTLGRRIALRLGLPFVDADAAIEDAAGCTVAELFARFGEAEFRRGERQVLGRLLGGAQAVVATGGGAVTDRDTRRLIRERAVSVWLRCALPVLARRIAGRSHRPLLRDRDPLEVLGALEQARARFYAEADLALDCGDGPSEATTAALLGVLARAPREPQRVRVPLAARAYDVLIGANLLERAAGLLAPVLPGGRCVVVSDTTTAALHGNRLLRSFGDARLDARIHTVPPGEASKSLARFELLAEEMLAAGLERRTTVVALGGGVIGDLAGFAAATLMRGLPFVQVPTTLLAQVDSSVGGKVGVNTRAGKNLLGAFQQPLAVLADTGTLATLPVRERRAGYAEIAKAGLIADRALFGWCEAHGDAVIGGDTTLQAEAVARACAFKAAVVVDDEREEQPEGGRALLNLGHTFAHALEAEFGFDGRLLHGEAVAVGCGLAFALSARLGHCAPADAALVRDHFARIGLPARIGDLPARLSAAALLAHMGRDKKWRDGQLGFVLARGIGDAFTDRTVPPAAVLDTLRAAGCTP